VKNEKIHSNKPVNRGRRKMLQGAACIGVAGFAPSAVGHAFSDNTLPADPASSQPVSGELICNISNPVKTLVLRNISNQTIAINRIDQSAFMFDGSIVDCNTACQSEAIKIPANKEIQIQFDRRQQAALTHVDEFQRVQSRVTRRGDGTRVIPFVATLHDGVASII